MSNKFIKTIPILLITLILVFSSIFYIQITKGASSNNLTTFYFKDVLGINSEPIYDSNLGLTLLVSEDFPIKSNDSFYPPKLFNGLNLNTEEWITWFSTTWIFYFLEDLTGDYDDFDDLDDLFEGFELLFPNPLRIVESYEYNGSEKILINGDVNFNLFLSSKIFSKINSNDKITVGLYSLNPNSIIPIPIKISNKTIDITPEFTQNIEMYDIIIENVNHTLDPGESLLFEIELIPGNKTVIDNLIADRPILEELANRTIEMLYNIANNSDNQSLTEIIEIIEMIDDIASEANITKEDAGIVLNSMISTSLVYDSINHPSSVSLPFSIESDYDQENNVIYYLHSNNLMNFLSPESDEHLINDLTTSNNWNGPILDRSKILEEVNVFLYISYKDINYLSDNIKINGKILYKNQEIGISEFILDKTQILSPIKILPINMIFNGFQDIEIEYDEYLSLELTIDNTTGFGSGILRSVDLFYDSVQYPSRMSIIFSETNHIQLNIANEPSDNKIIPLGSVKYYVDIISELDDEIEIVEISKTGNMNYWDLIIPDKTSFSSGENKTIEITVISTENDLDLYGESIEIKFSVQGKTGKNTFIAEALISEDAVDYDIKIIKPPEKDIRHGTSASYYFIVENNNTGLWPDSYSIEATSENDWNISINPENIDDIDVGETIEINATVFVPKNTEILKDELTLIIYSENGDISKTVNLTSNIIGPNLIENIYSFFESLSMDLGLDEIFNEYSPHALVAIIFIIVFIIIILAVFLLTSKFVNIICTDRVKEISPDQIGIFKIKVVNPTKKIRNYTIDMVEKNNKSKWNISFSENKISLNPKQTKDITLNIKPTDLVQKNDWTEFDIIVKTDGKRKFEKISTMLILKNSFSKISLKEINHTPYFFKNGEKIITSFVLYNHGNISTDKLNVKLFINGEEKNKVGDIIIPAEGFAEIKIPWIAVKGKNELNIVVKNKIN